MIKCGIIGCGVIAPTHIEGYRSLPEVEVIHLCDLIPERVNALGDKYGIARRSVDYKELLADPEVDAVSVCTDPTPATRRSSATRSRPAGMSSARKRSAACRRTSPA